MIERDLEGGTVLVTGGGRGIGLAISTAYARRGANVVIAYLRQREAAEEACSRISEHGVKAVPIRCHVGEVDALEGLFAQIDEMFGRLDAFISNAATGVIRPAMQLDHKAWDWTMDSNARPLLLGAREASRLMDKGGDIVALSSLGSTRVLPGYAVVGASKAAIEALVRYLAVELAEQHIRVNCVAPGVVDTDALRHFPARDDIIDRALSSTPAGRLATPDDVADTVMFLTSPAARMITGQTITVDGGASLLAG